MKQIQILAGRTVEYSPLNWQITARVVQWLRDMQLIKSITNFEIKKVFCRGNDGGIELKLSNYNKS